MIRFSLLTLAAIILFSMSSPTMADNERTNPTTTPSATTQDFVGSPDGRSNPTATPSFYYEETEATTPSDFLFDSPLLLLALTALGVFSVYLLIIHMISEGVALGIKKSREREAVSDSSIPRVGRI